ncbi:hypothetical protein COSO111634_34440 [Corallococcus soli]
MDVPTTMSSWPEHRARSAVKPASSVMYPVSPSRWLNAFSATLSSSVKVNACRAPRRRAPGTRGRSSGRESAPGRPASWRRQ